MKNKKLIGGVLLLLLLLLVLFLVFLQRRGRAGGTPSASGKEIRIGAKDFTENVIVAEIYALALEERGYKVTRIYNVAGSLIHNAIVSDEIDLYPEYTGTGLLSVLKLEMETDPDTVYETVSQEYKSRFNLIWLDYAPANDSQGLVIRADRAEEYGIRTISDLQREAAGLRFASQGTFDEREDGILGLEKLYGPFDWKSSNIYDNSLKYAVLENDEADVTPAYTTEGQLVRTDVFRLLEDDRQFWPPYNLAPVIQGSLLEKNPEISAILNDISKTLHTETVTALNAKVDVEGEEYKDVARQYYDSIR